MKIKRKIISYVLSAAMLVSVVAVGNLSVSAKEQFIPENNTNLTADKKDNTSEESKNYVDGEAVVLLEDTNAVSSGDDLSDSIDVAGDIKVEDVEKFTGKGNNFSVATVSSDKMSTEELVSNLNKSDEIKIAEPNYIYKAFNVSNDTYSNYQWHLDNKGNNNGNAGADINPETVWDMKTPAQDKEQVVAVLDTGVDYTHPDLKDRMWVNPYKNKLGGNHGFDFTGANEDSSPMDNNGHGTHCAGTIAANQNNNMGIAGISQNTKIMALKWLDEEGYGELEDVVAAYNYVYKAMKLGVNVVAINNSWGGYSNSKILLDLINKVGELGAVSVCAAGNESQNLDKEFNIEEYFMDWEWDEFFSMEEDEIPNPANRVYPACYESDYIVAVAATDETGDVANYSNYGKETVEVAAPGTNILSAYNENMFNPVIYNDGEKTSQYFTKDFNSKIESVNDNATISVKETNSDYFTDTTGDKTSLEITVKNAQYGGVYGVSIPYTAKDSEQNPYISAMAKIINAPTVSEDEEEISQMLGIYNEIDILDLPADNNPTNVTTMESYLLFVNPSEAWEHISGKTYNKKAGERKITILFNCKFDGDYTFAVDGIGLSKGTKGEEEAFGKYEFMSGTSAAAPIVTGEAALLKEKYPDLTAKQIVEKINGSVTQAEKYDKYVRTSGFVDLSKIKNPVPVINSVNCKNDGSLVINGTNLKDSTITINDKNIKVLESTDTSVKTDKLNLNSNAELKLTTPNGYALYEKVLISGTKYKKLSLSDAYFDKYSMASDGKKIYVVNSYGYVNEYDGNGNGNYDDEDYEDYEDFDSSSQLDKHFKSVIGSANSSYEIRNVLYYNGCIYFIAKLKLTSVYNDEPYYSQSVIVKVDINKDKYYFINMTDDLDGASIGILNGTLYLIGGYSYSNEKLSTKVYKYNSGKWVAAPSLPTARALGKCIQVNNSQLVYTLGTDGTDSMPKNLIFDGKTWKESKKQLTTKKSNTYKFNDKKYTYYEGGADLVAGGILYTGVLYDGYGDTVKYTVSKDEYTHCNNYYMSKNTDIIRGLVVNNKFFGTACELDTYTEKDYFGEPMYSETDYYSIGYSFGVTSGMYNVKVDAKHGKVTGAGNYYPGETVVIKAKAKNGYKVKSITVNGKTYNKNSVSFKATKNTSVKVNYTPLVKSIKLNVKKKTLEVGKTLKLKATVKASKGANKKLIWSKSNSKVATMKKLNNNSVKITAKKKGTIVITVKSKDGSKKSAKCTIKVK